ncbi:hypothetical protein SLA2020_452230 [Shorea laevis]
MGGAGNEEKALVESREWYLAAYAPEGVPTSDHLKLRTVPLSLAVDSIPDGHVVVQNLLISVDPYQRTRLTGLQDGLYFPQFKLNEVVTAFTVGRVDPTSGVPLPDVLSSLGVPGFAAWVGIEVLGDPKPGSNVFISAAAGAVGMYAGQLAKLKGCRVIGSTGSDEKVKLIKEEFGYDDAFNYKKETDLDAALSKYFPDGIDVYFDNVGGEMLEAVLNHVNKQARIPVCGMISQYKKIWTEREGYIKEGKISSKFKMYHGIESYLESLGSLFTSSNVGKVIIEVNP